MIWGMSTTAKVHTTIQQGATYRDAWRRGSYPYAVRLHAGKLVRADNGRPVNQEDFTPIDYTGCTARLQARLEVGAPGVLLEFSTTPTLPEQGRIELTADGYVVLHLSAEQTAALPAGEGRGQWLKAIGHLEVTYSDGTVRREYEIRFTLSPEVTR